MLFKVVGVVAVIMIVGLGANAFAYRGMGSGKGGGYGCEGYGMQRGGGGPWADLSEEDRNKADQLRQTFFKEIAPSRRALYEKEMALRAELAKETPSAETATSLQKEISTLQADLDQKRINHVLAMKKINPNAGRGFGFHGGRSGGGYGKGGGNCWR